jgi:uncharacterized protein (UPF0333 family)
MEEYAVMMLMIILIVIIAMTYNNWMWMEFAKQIMH